MTERELLLLVAEIDAWIWNLEESRLSGQCRKSGNSFFQFMQSRGVNAAYIATLVQAKTGYHPKTLCTIEDAQLLRQAIFSYEVVPKQIEFDETEAGRTFTSKEVGDRAWKRF